MSVVLSAAAVEPEVPADGICDAEGLFRLSGLIDQVRDTAKFLVKVDASAATTPSAESRSLADTYNLVRDAAPQVLTSEASDFVDRSTRRVDGSASSALVFCEASLLAKAFDVLINTPGFVLTRRIAHSESGRLHSRLNDASPDQPIGEVLSAPAQSDQMTAGTYL